MNDKQNLSILFYLKRKKATKDGKIPIYIRIIRTSTKKISQARTDIERHFDLMQAKNGIATAEMVKKSYMTPVSVQKMRHEKAENLKLSESIDQLINRYIDYCKREKKAYGFKEGPSPEKLQLLNLEKEELKKSIETQAKKANLIFDNKDWQKTFILTIDEYLLDFVQLSFIGYRSSNTLEKWMCRKRRFVDFFRFRYKKVDMVLAQMEYKMLDELKTYLLTQHKVIENTATKFIQCLKGLMERAAYKGWININPFAIYKCKYNTPDHDWLSMNELELLKEWNFEKEKLNIIRDIFLFGSFTGYSYEEIYSLKQSQIITDSDGKKWVSKKRQKTKTDESVPLLPLPMQILEKYKDHPVCERTGRLLPVPSNQQYNRCLKEIASETKIDIVLRTHKSRFFFANEVTYNNGVPLKTVSRMMGHKSVKTTEVYVHANKRNISENMDMVEKKLFEESGELKNSQVIHSNSKTIPGYPDNNNSNFGAKVIRMVNVTR